MYKHLAHNIKLSATFVKNIEKIANGFIKKIQKKNYVPFTV